MLSMLSSFTEMDIADVQELRRGTVYKLTGQGGEQLIIKAEAPQVTQQTLSHSTRAMKVVDKRGGNTKALGSTEKNALKSWAEFMQRTYKDIVNNQIHKQMHQLADDLLYQIKGAPTWYKMPLADLTDAERLLLARMGGADGTEAVDKSGVRQFAEGLKADGGLEQLGKIIAADMYIGNLDRFNPDGSTTNPQYGGKNFSFKVLVNPGNLFVIGKNTEHRMSVSGHDFLDPNSQHRDYSKSLGDIDVAWPGDALCDKARRQKFAKHIVHDLETILSPNRKSHSPFRKLPGNAPKRVERGILTGMADIVRSLDAEYGNMIKIAKHAAGQTKVMPDGVKERLDRYRRALG